jgi:hypothetical protein
LKRKGREEKKKRRLEGRREGGRSPIEMERFLLPFPFI